MTKQCFVRRWTLPTALAAVLLLAAACSGGSETTPTSEVSDPTAAPAIGAAETAVPGASTDLESSDFPTGEAVLVAAGYEHPADHVDNTGAFLPANGKPTVVFVDAIW